MGGVSRMNRMVKVPEVLTLAEAARYLRLPQKTVREQARAGKLPGRQIGNQWRFLKSALEDWLGSRKALTGGELLQHIGAFKGDPTLRDMLKEIYAARGRPEVEDGPDS